MSNAQHSVEELLQAVRASEHRVMAAICTFEDHGSYEIFRSDEFPEFYAGNGIAVRRRESDSLAYWVEIFHRHFDPARYRHVTLAFEQDSWSDSLREQAAAQPDFSESIETAMAAPADRLIETGGARSDRQPRLLQSGADMDALYRLHLDESRDKDWYLHEDDFRGLHNKTLAISERVGIRWIGIDADDTRELSSALGFFDHAGLCRLQHIITAAPARGRGLASRLIADAAARARRRGIETVGLITEIDSDPHRLYRRLGFSDLGSELTLMAYARAPTSTA